MNYLIKLKTIFKVIAIIMLVLALVTLFFYIYISVNDIILKDSDFNMIYHEKKYIYYDFHLFKELYGHYELHTIQPKVVGKTMNFYVSIPTGMVEVYVSEFDTEKNILYISGRSSMFIKEGYELPDVFECRINSIVISKDGEVVFETDSDFLTLNQMISERTVKPDTQIHINTPMYLFFKDYPYLKSPFYVIHFENKIYIFFKELKGDVVNDEFFIIKDEYAHLFPPPEENTQTQNS